MMIEVVKSKQIGGNNNKTVLKVARVSNRNNWLNSWSSSDASSLPRCLAHGRVRCPVHCPPHCPKHDLAHGPAHGSKLDPAHGPAHGSKHGPADDSAQCLTLISLSGTEQSQDRKSTRLNSSHVSMSYAVFCMKK